MIEEIVSLGPISLDMLREKAGSYTKDTLTRAEATDLAKRVAPFVKRLAHRFHIAGSYRRGNPTSGDLDFVTTDCDLAKLMALLTEKLGATSAPRAGNSVLTTIIPFKKKQIQVEFVNVKDKSYGAALLHSTGGGEFNMGLRSWVKGKGLLLNQHGLFNVQAAKWLAGNTEEDIFKYIGLNFIPPEKRNEPFSRLKKEFCFDENKGRSLNVRSPEGVKNWKVKSSKDPSVTYTVQLSARGAWSCNCKGFMYNKDCSHIDYIRKKIK